MGSGLRGLLAFFWKHRLYSLLGILCLLVSDASQMVVPLLVQQAIDPLVAGTATASLMMHQAVTIALISVFTYAARWGWRYFMFTSARLSEREIRQQLFEHALRLNATFHGRTRSGEVMALATNDVGSVRMALAFGLMASFDSIAYLCMGLSAMFWLDWRLTLWTLLPYPLLAIVMKVVLERIYRSWDRVQSSFEDFTEKTRESIAGIKVLRSYRQGAPDLADFQGRTEELYQRNMTHTRWDASYSPSVLLMSGASLAILLGVGGRHVIDGVTTLGGFAAFSSYLGQLIWPMIAMGWTVSIVQRAAASMKRIQDFLARDPETESPPLEGVVARGALRVDDLSFQYPGADQFALRHVSLEVPAGTSLGLVGEVGSGKSTLPQVLLRLYDPAPGQVFLDDHDVLEYNLGQLRERVAWVNQEAFLFSDTITNNLKLAAPEATDEQIREASRLASLHREVEEFPRKYETLLGERGVTLSGGQRQRLSLARALLKPAPVLVLDDTLSAVDAETEVQILEALSKRRSALGQTTIVISHRISSVKDLDQILVLERGAVVQRGRHADLLRQEGHYRRLYELQRLEEGSPAGLTGAGLFSPGGEPRG